MSFFQMPTPSAARRIFLGRTGLTLSGAAVALLAGNEVLAAKTGGKVPSPFVVTPVESPHAPRVNSPTSHRDGCKGKRMART